MGKARSVYHIVIDHKPDCPADVAAWNTECRNFMTRGDPYAPAEYDPDTGEYRYGEGYGDWFDQSDALRHWAQWYGGRRTNYLSSRAAKEHVERLTKHGIIAHIAVGTVVWETDKTKLHDVRVDVAKRSLVHTVKALS